MKTQFVVLAVMLELFASTSFGGPARWSSLIDRLADEGHNKSDLEALFSNAEFDPDPVRSKLTSLFESKFKATRILKIQEGLHALGYNPGPQDGLSGPKTSSAIRAFQRDRRLMADGRASMEALAWIQHTLDPKQYSRPETVKKPSVYKSMLQEERLSEAWEFWQKHRQALQQLYKDYGVPEDIAVAILAVETRVGKYLGSKKAFLSLASLALASDLGLVRPMFANYMMTRERDRWLRSTANRISNWAYRELSALLRYSREAGLSTREIPGSIYGAIGVSQFMPSNAVRFGVDGNSDGVANLFDVEDALSSMGNFLKANGWRSGLSSRSGQARVIYRYNRSRTYVNTVLAVAERLREIEAQAA
jgi:membrane-bound lytic murein transglycosylase B